MRVKRLRNIKYVKYFIYKTDAENNETFHVQIMLTGANKYARIICDTCSQYQIYQ